MTTPNASPVHEIELRGQKIPIRSQGEPELVEETLRLARAGIRSAESRVRREQAPHHVLLLAYLELAEEYVRATRGLATYQQEVASKAESLMNLLDRPSS